MNPWVLAPASSRILAAALLLAGAGPVQARPDLVFKDDFEPCITIGGLCWAKENFNQGVMIPAGTRAADNGVLEKWCYEDSEANCETYGGLYEFSEAMGHRDKLSFNQRWQGICPDGWRLPTHHDWVMLEGAVDSMYGVDDPIWDERDERGLDAGTKLKSTSGWKDAGDGSNEYGFNAMPAGLIYNVVVSTGLGEVALFWTSEGRVGFGGGGDFRAMDFNAQGIRSSGTFNYMGFSVRCVRN